VTETYQHNYDDRPVGDHLVEQFADVIGLGVGALCPFGAVINEVIPFFAKGTKGEKFRLCVLVESSGTGTGVGLVELFGSVKFLKLKIEDYRNGSVDAKKYDKISTFDTKEDVIDKINSMVGWFKKERRPDAPYWMSQLSADLNEHLDCDVAGHFVRARKDLIEGKTIDDLIEDDPFKDIPVVNSAGEEKSWHEDW
jgi:hypothetical protein